MEEQNIFSERLWKGIALAFLGLLVFSFAFDVNVNVEPRFGKRATPENRGDGAPGDAATQASAAAQAVLPPDGFIIPVVWSDLGRRMINAGAIDTEKFESVYVRRGGLNSEMKSLLYEESNGRLTITQENAGVLLNMLWAFGLSNTNPILTEGPMMSMQYGGDAGRFASTGGWTLARGDAMNHYSAHAFVVLTSDQQKKVEEVSKNIFRPCCGNNTYFPDCNHGMAMLGLLELLASQNASEEVMYAAALAVNSYWFPDTYMTIAAYFAERGVEWNAVDPKTVLGSTYSSASGYQEILKQVKPAEPQGGGGCGV